MGIRQTRGVLIGTHRSPEESTREINAELAIVTDTDAGRVTTMIRGRKPVTVQHPRITTHMAFLQDEIRRRDEAEEHANRPIASEFKTKRPPKIKPTVSVCPDCDGLQELDGAPCLRCEGEGWIKIG